MIWWKSLLYIIHCKSVLCNNSPSSWLRTLPLVSVPCWLEWNTSPRVMLSLLFRSWIRYRLCRALKRFNNESSPRFGDRLWGGEARRGALATTGDNTSASPVAMKNYRYQKSHSSIIVLYPVLVGFHSNITDAHERGLVSGRGLPTRSTAFKMRPLTEEESRTVFEKLMK